MILSYVIKNDSTNDALLEPNEVWKFVVNVDDEHDAYSQLQKVNRSASVFGHTIMNVYLNSQPFDAREFWTEGANANDWQYDESVQIHRVQDETVRRR